MTHSSHETSVVVLGAGWLGAPLAASLARTGSAVWTVRRSPRANVPPTDGVTAIEADLTSSDAAATLAGVLLAARTHVDHVVLCVAPSRARGDDHGSTYPATARTAMTLASAVGARSVLYTSSTGVYTDGDGAWVDESSPLATSDPRTRALVDAERIVLDEPAAASRLVLRVAGLYGPDRDPAPRFATRDASLGDADRWCNFAWRDDVISAVGHLLARATPGAHVLNCADGTPVRAGDIARALDAGPTSAPLESTRTPQVAGSSRGAPAHRRVRTDAIRATGWSPAVPDVFAGLSLLGHQVVRPIDAHG